MNPTRLLMIPALLSLACATSKSARETEPGMPAEASLQETPQKATAKLEPRSNSSMHGMAHFESLEDGRVHVRVDIEGAEPGEHAVHLHETGDCSAPDASSAGGHWNPTSHDHGKWNEADGDFHLGDIGNIHVAADGKGSVALTTNRWELGTGGMVDVTGLAVVVHAKPDDFVSQPSGNAGGREACGVVALGG